MSTYAQTTLLNFVLTLSPADEINPYSQTEERLHVLLQPPEMLPWCRWIQRVILGIYVLIFLQSSSLLFWRIKTSKFHFIGLNAMGLIKFDCISLCALVGTIYSTVAITDMVWKEIIMDGYYDQSWQLILFGCKFLLVMTASWCFLWVCIGHWLLQQARNSHRELNEFMPPVVAWAMNGLFVFMAFWPNAPILVKYFQINSDYLAVKAALDPIMKKLSRSAMTYSPDTYNQAGLILRLMPAQAALPHLDNIGDCLRVSVILYLISNVILYVAYIPFIYLLVKGSRKFRIASEEDSDSVEETKSYSHVEAERLRYLNDKFRQQHEAVLQHVVMTYLSTIVYVPVVIWLIICSFQDAYFMKSYWWNIALTGLHGPYAIVTAISLYLLHQSVSAF